MRIEIKSFGSETYVEVMVVSDDVTIDLGLLDDRQRRELAAELADAVSRLLEKDR